MSHKAWMHRQSRAFRLFCHLNGLPPTVDLLILFGTRYAARHREERLTLTTN